MGLKLWAYSIFIMAALMLGDPSLGQVSETYDWMGTPVVVWDGWHNPGGVRYYDLQGSPSFADLYLRSYLDSSASYSLTGRAVDQNGNGLPGVRLSVSSYEGGNFGAVTDAFGYYRMNLPSGYYTLTAGAPGYTFPTVSIRVIADIPTVAPLIMGYSSYQTALPSAGYVQGKVADERGAGVAGASIYIDGLQTGVYTDAQGSFSLPLQPGAHKVEAHAQGYGVSTSLVTVTQGLTSRLEMVAPAIVQAEMIVQKGMAVQNKPPYAF
jgi:hypothetical protein